MFTWAVVLACLVCVSSAIAVAAGQTEKPDDHTDQWQWLHGREYVRDSARCDGCHEPMSCRTCHLVDYPHPQDWQGRHGAEALAMRFRGCSLCHRDSFCDPCHGGVTMPHPEDYLRTHSRGGDVIEACGTCHLSTDCDGCHDAHASHGWGGASP